jgi:hypothetical protein
MSPSPNAHPGGEFVLYQTEDGQNRIQCQLVDGTIWLSQMQMGELFQRSKKTISEHLQNIFEEGELAEAAVVRNFRTTAADDKLYDVAHYNLEAVIAVGMRVKSVRGTQFRRWANTQLKEFIVKGFVMDDERLKNPGGWDHFDELLARIREIRASEQRFYQKVRDLFALSDDYQASDSAAQIVVDRSNPDAPNMALTAWSGSRVRKQDVIVAKNYLTADEVDTLNRLVVIFLEQAELRVKERKQLTLDYWRQNVDRLLEFNERPVLQGAGRISAKQMKGIAHERYEAFDARRRSAEALAADAEDLRMLESVEKQAARVKIVVA